MPDLVSARAESEVLEALAVYLGGVEAEVPRAVDLAGYWPVMASADKTEANRRLTAIAGEPPKPREAYTGLVEWTIPQTEDSPLELSAEWSYTSALVARRRREIKRRREAAKTEGPKTGGATKARRPVVVETGAQAFHKDVLAAALDFRRGLLPGGRPLSVIQGVHRRWVELLEADEDREYLHPLGPLVSSWQARPKAVEADSVKHPRQGVLPAPLKGVLMHVEFPDEEPQLPWSPEPVVQEDPAWLPGFAPPPGEVEDFGILEALHCGGLRAFGPGRGAPIPLRLAFEILLDVPLQARGVPVVRRYPVSGGENALRRILWPTGRDHLHRDWESFVRSLWALSAVKFLIHYEGNQQWWRPLHVRTYPAPRDGDGVLEVVVTLPPGSDRGPRIIRPVLRRLGAKSYPQWRAWLLLSCLWDRSAVNGQWIRGRRPRVARDSAGNLVDLGGGVLLDRRGRPVTRWTDPRSVPLDKDGCPVQTLVEAAQERNPYANRHPWLSAPDILKLGYPPDETVKGAGLRMRKARVLEDLHKFEAGKLVTLEVHPDGQRWRVMPPAVDPD